MPGGQHVRRAVVGEQPSRLIAQGGHKGPVGEGGAGQRRRLAEQDPRPASGPLGLGAEFLDEPGLADAGCPGDQQHLRAAGHNPRVGGQQRLPFGDPSHDGRGPGGRPRRRLGQRAVQRREPLWQARGDKLVDVLRRLDVLQPVPAQVPEGCPGWQPGAGQLPRRLRQHDLGAVRDRRDPGRPVYVQPHIPVLVPDRLTGMQPHPHPHRNPVRPVMAAQGTLGGNAAADRVNGRAEHNEEAVSLGAHLLAATVPERGPQQGALS